MNDFREEAERVWQDGQDAFINQQDGSDGAVPVIAAALQAAYRKGVEDGEKREYRAWQRVLKER